MADYKKMYLELINEMEKAIEALQKSMLRAEEIYIETDENEGKEEK